MALNISTHSTRRLTQIAFWTAGILPASSILPFTSNGSLGALAPSGNVAFNTTNGTYKIGSTVYGGGRTVTIDTAGTPQSVIVFDFSSISIAQGTSITAAGNSPLYLLAQGAASINGTIDVSGKAGGAAGSNGGGGGGGGGGVLGIFAGSISVGSTGQILAQGRAFVFLAE